MQGVTVLIPGGDIYFHFFIFHLPPFPHSLERPLQIKSSKVFIQSKTFIGIDINIRNTGMWPHYGFKQITGVEIFYSCNNYRNFKMNNLIIKINCVISIFDLF